MHPTPGAPHPPGAVPGSGFFATVSAASEICGRNSLSPIAGHTLTDAREAAAMTSRSRSFEINRQRSPSLSPGFEGAGKAQTGLALPDKIGHESEGF